MFPLFRASGAGGIRTLTGWNLNRLLHVAAMFDLGVSGPGDPTEHVRGIAGRQFMPKLMPKTKTDQLRVLVSGVQAEEVVRHLSNAADGAGHIRCYAVSRQVRRTRTRLRVALRN
jgi:nitrogen regulatory protein PII